MIQITDNVWIGTTTEALNEKAMHSRHLKFKAILSCTTVVPPAVQAIPRVIYGRVDVPDYTPWSEAQKQYAANFIAECSADRKVFVHSDLGEGRCAEAIYFYLVRFRGMKDEEAKTFIQNKAPHVRLRPIVLTGTAPVPAVGVEHPPPPEEGVVGPPVVAAQPAPPVEAPVELSVISVTWNRVGMVKEALQALVDTTPPSAEIIVIDNGSMDGTEKYLLEHIDRVKVVWLGRNYGKGVAANIGFKIGQRKMICYLDSDIKVPEGWYEEVLSLYEKVPNAGLMSLPYKNIVHRVDSDQPYTNFNLSQITGGMMFMSRSVLDTVGGYLEDRLYGFLDVDYIKRAQEKGYKVGYVASDLHLEHLGTQDTVEYKDWKKIQRHDPVEQVPERLNLPPVEIIMVRFNLPEIEAQCIESVMRSTRWAYRLNVVDNFGAKEPLGVLWNRLIEASPFDHVLLLNSDCIVTEGWLTKLMETMATDPQIGVVGPSTNACGTKQRIVPDLPPSEADAYALKIQEEYRGQYVDEEISGFSYLLRKEAWKKVGGFSPNFGHYGQETELNFRLRHAGFKVVWSKPSFVFHYWGMSIKAAAERGEMDVDKERLLGGAILQQLRAKMG